MAAVKKAATTKKTTKKATSKDNASIVVIETHVGHDLVIRANPTDEEVRAFISEHHRRFLAGEPGGPSGLPAYRQFNAKRYSSEEAYIEGTAPVAEIDVSDLLATP